MSRVTVKPGAKLSRLQKQMGDATPLLKGVGVLVVAASQRAFKDQRLGNVAWKSRAPVNVFGIIADFAGGARTPPNRRFERRPALQNTGDLRRKIASTLVPPFSVDIGTTLHYAAVHQFGGKVESKPLTDQVRDLLHRWLRRQPATMKRRLGWLLNDKLKGKTLTQVVPARPFLGITPELVDTIKKALGVKIATGGP